MTPQQVFDTVVTHLVTQGRRAVHPNGFGALVCKCLIDDALKCAVGCLIPDNAYTPDPEGTAAKAALLLEHPDLLLDLQEVHDILLSPNSTGLPQDALHALRGVAVAHNLDPAVVPSAS